MNQVTFTGNLCRDIDIRQASNGTSLGSTALAVRRDRKNEKGEYDTDFFELRLFGTQADFASKYLRKGDRVGVVGRVQIRDYTTKDGVKGRAIEVLVNAIESLEPKQEVQEQKESQPVTSNTEELEVSDDDLPF